MPSFLVLAAAVAVVFAVPVAAHAQAGCEPLPAPSGAIVDVTPAQVARLQSILDAARSGDTIQLADGRYSLSHTLVLRKPGVTVRSQSGNRDAVVLDGGYDARDLILIQQSNITIADLTLTRADWHLVHVVPARGTLS